MQPGLSGAKSGAAVPSIPVAAPNDWNRLMAFDSLGNDRLPGRRVYQLRIPGRIYHLLMEPLRATRHAK
jgi:hypothetical protein